VNKLFTEKSTLLVGVLVGILVLMRIGLQAARPGSTLSRMILWWWHPAARKLALSRSQGDEAGESWRSIHGLTIQNMDSTLVALALVFFVIRPVVVQAFYIPSSSMEPTLMGSSERQDRVLVNKFIYRFRAPKRQEIVVFHAPPGALQDPTNGTDFIKRLIGLPGDTVEVRENRAYINGQPLDEPYLDESKLISAFRFEDPAGNPDNFGPVVVPPGKYLMLGDNRTNSHDSRRWGRIVDGQFEHEPFVAADQVLGKAMCVFWPPKAIKLLRTPGNN